MKYLIMFIILISCDTCPDDTKKLCLNKLNKNKCEVPKDE